MIFLSYFAYRLVSLNIDAIPVPKYRFSHLSNFKPSISALTGASFISDTLVLRGTVIDFVVTYSNFLGSHSIIDTLYVGFTNVPLIYALKYVLSSRE